MNGPFGHQPDPTAPPPYDHADHGLSHATDTLSVSNRETGDAATPPTALCLPLELLTLVAKELDSHCLASFSAACTSWLAVAQDELRAAFHATVSRRLVLGDGPLGNAFVTSRHFRLPDDLNLIPAGGFCGNTSLKRLVIPPTVVSIGPAAFCGCSALHDLRLPAALVAIGDGAFSGCSSLDELTLPDTVTTIGVAGFAGCTSIPEVALPASIANIGRGAFHGCSSLSVLTLPAEAETSPTQRRRTECEGAVDGCTRLTMTPRAVAEEEASPDSVLELFAALGCDARGRTVGKAGGKGGAGTRNLLALARARSKSFREKAISEGGAGLGNYVVHREERVGRARRVSCDLRLRLSKYVVHREERLGRARSARAGTGTPPSPPPSPPPSTSAGRKLQRWGLSRD